MSDEIDVLDEEQVEVESPEDVQQDEPQTTLPDRPSGQTKDRQDVLDETFAEGEAAATADIVIEELGDVEKHPELTVEDLRKIPGAEDMTDAQIISEWNKAVAQASGQTGQTGQVAADGQTVKLPFPVFDDKGNKIEALEKISVADLFNGKIKLGYNANGKEQQKTLAETLRNASMGHFNEQKYNTALAERNQVFTKAGELEKQVAQFTDERKVWDAALTALAMGNIEPMKRLAQAYQTALTQTPQATPGMIPISQVQAEQEQAANGQRFINEVVVPNAMEIAKKYDADPKEVAGAIETLIRRDLGFLTKEKIEQIIQYEVPALFEANGYTANATPAGQAQAPDKVAELEKTVAALQSRIAAGANQSTQQTRAKQKKAPPAGSGATPGAGDSMPNFKSRAAMKAWMQGDPDWVKA